MNSTFNQVNNGQPLDLGPGYMFDPIYNMYFHEESGKHYDPNSGWFYDAQSGYYIDPGTGYYYHQESGMYYDPNSGMWYNGQTGEWISADQQVATQQPQQQQQTDYLQGYGQPYDYSAQQQYAQPQTTSYGTQQAMYAPAQYANPAQVPAPAAAVEPVQLEPAVLPQPTESSVYDGVPQPTLNADVPQPSGAATESETPEQLEADEDRTVIVTRVAKPKWEIVLPSGEHVQVSDDSVILGRKPGVGNITIPDQERTMSKRHARIALDGDKMRIEDLGSTNGTYIVEDGGEPQEVEPYRPTEFSGQIILGTLPITVRRLP